jgi:hypothetical protein
VSGNQTARLDQSASRVVRCCTDGSAQWMNVSKLVAALLLAGAMLALAACGGSKQQTAARGGGGRGEARACGSPYSPSPPTCVELTSDDLAQTFFTWPGHIERAYRNGYRFDVYTDLDGGDSETAANICLQVFIDATSERIRNPLIVVWSAGADTILATGATEGVGCTAG